MVEPKVSDTTPPTPNQPTRDVGWMPAIMAVMLLGLMVLLITCGIGSWVIFNRSPQLAAGSLKSQFIPVIEQSMLEPDTKKQVIRQLNTLVSQLETDQWEPAASRTLMQRLIRAPIVQWGDLDGLLVQIQQRDGFTTEERDQASRTVGQLKRAAELETVSANDFEDALQPATSKDESLRGCHFNLAVTDEELREVLKRAKLLIERAKVPDESFDVTLSDLLRLQIENARDGKTMTPLSQ